jgi:glutamyl-Q tRNA(Asp) synthetase
MSNQPYIGRFAPSPTGPLHFGSLVAAVASYLQARSQEGIWRVRIEDIDPPREVAGAASHILRTLEAYGMDWDGEVMYQSTRGAAYDHAINALIKHAHAYACSCSRRDIRNAANPGPFGAVYPGICRERDLPGGIDVAIRVKTEDRTVHIEDGNLGRIDQNLNSQLGDFIVKRRDGLYAYQLAVVVDDAFQDITEVVRGADLLDSTPRQCYLQRLLGLPTPGYFHLPIATDHNGEKLAKQNGASPIPATDTIPCLLAALRFLNQDPDASLLDADLDEFWRWAVEHWHIDKVPKVRAIPYTPNGKGCSE